MDQHKRTMYTFVDNPYLGNATEIVERSSVLDLRCNSRDALD